MANVPVQANKTNGAPAPTDPWSAFRAEMDQLFDRFSGGFGFPALRRMTEAMPMWRPAANMAVVTPAVDITEDEQAFKLVAEMPGMSENDVEISVEDGMLVLRGEKQQQKEDKQPNYRLTERTYGAFERSFDMPDSVDVEKIAAEFGKGILTVTLPKKPGAVADVEKIEVKPAA